MGNRTAPFDVTYRSLMEHMNMAQQPIQRSKADRIERLRQRLQAADAYGADRKITDVIKGILDLLADEL